MDKLKNKQTLIEIGWEEYPDTPPRLALSKVLADTPQHYHLHQNNMFSCKLWHYKLPTANTFKPEQGPTYKKTSQPNSHGILQLVSMSCTPTKFKLAQPQP